MGRERGRRRRRKRKFFFAFGVRKKHEKIRKLAFFDLLP